MSLTILEIKAAYQKAKDAPRGASVFCPSCGLEFVKKVQAQAFCSNGRTEGAGNCKDAYWNLVDEQKRNRKHSPSHYRKYNVGAKSAANRIGESYDNDFYAEDDYPEGWDGHKE